MKIVYDSPNYQFLIKGSRVSLDKNFVEELLSFESRIENIKKEYIIMVDIDRIKNISSEALFVLYIKTIKLMVTKNFTIKYNKELINLFTTRLKVITIYKKNKLVKKRLFNDLSGEDSFAIITKDDYEKNGINHILEEVMKDIYNICHEDMIIPEEIMVPIGETFTNAYEHSNDNFFGFSYSKHSINDVNTIVFTIIDNGISIIKSVKDYFEKKGSSIGNEDAFRWSLIETNTTKIKSGGLGFSKLKEIVKLNNGELNIITGDIIYTYDKTCENIDKLNNFLFGTIISIKIVYNEINHALFETKNESLNLFDAINAKGVNLNESSEMQHSI